MKRKKYPKFIAIKNYIINVSAIKNIKASRSSGFGDAYIDIEYFNCCEVKKISICFDDITERDEVFDEIKEVLL